MNDEIEDNFCIELVKAGNKKRDQGISILYRKYAKDLRRFFSYKCGNISDADDLVQEVFIKVVRSCETYRGDSTLKSWLWQIARNSFTDYVRHKKINATDQAIRPTSDSDEDGWEFLENKEPSLQVNYHETKDTIQDCFSRGYSNFAKSDPDRAYALSLLVNGYDSKKIAGFLNRTEGATREYLSQCRKKIEEFLLPCKELLATE